MREILIESEDPKENQGFIVPPDLEKNRVGLERTMADLRAQGVGSWRLLLVNKNVYRITFHNPVEKLTCSKPLEAKDSEKALSELSDQISSVTRWPVR